MSGNSPRTSRPKLKAIIKATGAKQVSVTSALAAHYDTVPYQSTHNTGGVIMGSDPSTSVVNNYLQMWDFDNVFVVGACNFPQNGGFNPTGTVGALAYRAADGIVNKYRKSRARSSSRHRRARPGRVLAIPVSHRPPCPWREATFAGKELISMLYETFEQVAHGTLSLGRGAEVLVSAARRGELPGRERPTGAWPCACGPWGR